MLELFGSSETKATRRSHCVPLLIECTLLRKVKYKVIESKNNNKMKTKGGNVKILEFSFIFLYYF